MITLESFLGDLFESVLTDRETAAGSLFPTTVEDSPNYDIKAIIRSRLVAMKFQPEINKQGPNKGMPFAAARFPDDPFALQKGAAKQNRFVHVSQIKQVLIDMVGGKEEFDKLSVGNQIDFMNDLLAQVKDFHSEEGRKIVDMLTELITASLNKRPKELLGTNLKMKHSNIGTIKMLKIGFPAFHSLFYDEKEEKWRLVKTCPDASECIGFCFAADAMYTMTANHAVSGTRLLNYLMNDPDRFSSQLAAEITKISGKLEGETKLYVRVNDSGDFFSEYQFDMFMDLARKLPNVTFFAYTKRLKLLTAKQKIPGAIPPNFIFNRSEGSKFSHGEKLGDEVLPSDEFDRSKLKHSTVIKATFFAQDPGLQQIYKGKVPSYEYMMRDEVSKKTGMVTLASVKKWEILKNFIANRFNRPVEKILNWDEFLEQFKTLDPKNPADVIVFPGNGDISATTHGVLGTYLIEH